MGEGENHVLNPEVEGHQYLTAAEAEEIMRITGDPDVIAFALLDLEGRELHSEGAWSDMLAPIFANAFDLTHRIGEEVGEDDTCNLMFVEGPSFDTISITLSATRAVVMKRKVKTMRGGLRSVS